MNIIETHDLCKQYGNALRVAHLDLNVPEGSVYGFLGPNGAGKSTTLKMILGLVRPTAGSIRVLGKTWTAQTDCLYFDRQVALLRVPATMAILPERRICALFRLCGMCLRKISERYCGLSGWTTRGERR